MRRVVVALALAFLCLPAAARADGDPASDFLLAQDVFLPFNTAIDADTREGLDAAISAAAANQFKIKVAIIAHQYDLGAVPQLFAKPQPYSEFLGQELKFVYPGRLLVVMPNGYGYARGGKPDAKLADALSSLPDPGQDGTALAASATAAVHKLAEAGGHPLPASAAATDSSGGSDRTLILIGIAVVLAALALAGAAVVLIRRRRRVPSP